MLYNIENGRETNHKKKVNKFEHRNYCNEYKNVSRVQIYKEKRKFELRSQFADLSRKQYIKRFEYCLQIVLCYMLNFASITISRETILFFYVFFQNRLPIGYVGARCIINPSRLEFNFHRIHDTVHNE